MPCCNNHNSLYQSIGKLVSLFLLFLSVFVIVFSVFSRNRRRYISQDRLRQYYDGLSPRDYE